MTEPLFAIRPIALEGRAYGKDRGVACFLNIESGSAIPALRPR